MDVNVRIIITIIIVTSSLNSCRM